MAEVKKGRPGRAPGQPGYPGNPGRGLQRSAMADSIASRREAFCRHYLAYPTMAEAARRTGISLKAAQDYMSEDGVLARIEQLAEERNQRVELEADDVLRALVDIAMADPADAFDENGNLLPIHTIPLSLRRVISSMESDEIIQPGTGKVVGHTKKIKFWDKTRGLEMLARHLALFNDSLTVRNGDKAELNEIEISARISALMEVLRERLKDAEDLFGDANAIKGETV
jgi:phage terminase small subunit